MTNHISVDRLQLIEQKLLAMEPARFQTMCDVYLAHREENIVGFGRTGSMLGKNKTTTGTPDTYFRFSDGTLGFVESTTQESEIISKIKRDISKCIDENKTGVEHEKVRKIIICHNSRLSLSHEMELTGYAQSNGINIELVGLDWLAIELYSKYLIIAKDFLGISLDTGQLLPLGKFVEEYDNKASNLSTPLDNIFLHRVIELGDISSALEHKDILIISGFSGVGKTKIALKAVEDFVHKNEGFTAFAVAKKDQDISDDLKINLHIDKDYILLVDDANRQLVTFKQILSTYREKRKGKLKLIITVRDYALSDVFKECFEYEPKKIILPKFSSDELISLIGSDSFGILDPKIQRKIVNISDGNARLAIMAARIAQKENDTFLLGNVSDLYDLYFQTFIRDFDLFENKELLKAIGIISFFFSIDRSNKPFITKVLEHFSVDYYEFNKSINELEKRELIEVRDTYVRISEQVMSTYFFYKVFIKDELLSYRELLFNFFETWSPRFGDTIIPSINSFGYENVIGKLKPLLDDYLLKVQSSEDSTYRFFHVFGRYVQDDILMYFFTKISALEEPIDPKYETTTNDLRFNINGDRVIEFLSIAIDSYNDNYRAALELSFEFCRKKPNELPDFLKILKDKVLHYDEDYKDRNLMQVELLNMLLDKIVKNDELFIRSFFTVIKHYLPNHYLALKPKEDDTSNRYLIINKDEEARKLRVRIWEGLFKLYDKYPTEVLGVIREYNTYRYSNVDEILKSDLKHITHFIDSNLDSTNFSHIHFVHDFFQRIDRREIEIDYRELRAKFNSKEYTVFLKLDWNTYRGKREYSFNTFEEFRNLKTSDLKRSFMFASSSEYELLLSTVIDAENANVAQHNNISTSLDIIITETIKKNKELGFELLIRFIKVCPDSLQPLSNPLKEIASHSKEWALTLWTIIKEMHQKSKIYWSLCFFSVLPEPFSDSFFKEDFLSMLTNTRMHYYLPHQCIDNFIANDNTLPVKVVEIIVSRVNIDNVKIQLPFHFFEQYSHFFINHLGLLQDAYIQQEQFVNEHFDIDYDGFKKICELDYTFVKTYINSYFNYETSEKLDSYKTLSFIWDWENGKDIIDECLEIMIQYTGYYTSLEHPINIFFRKLSDEQSVKASNFILKYIEKNYASSEKINAIIEVVRQSLKELFEESLLCYLRCKPDMQAFKNILWRESMTVYSGDVIIGEVRAKEWQEILDIVNKVDDQLSVLQIKIYIRKLIEGELKYAEHERIRKFAYPGY